MFFLLNFESFAIAPFFQSRYFLSNFLYQSEFFERKNMSNLEESEENETHGPKVGIKVNKKQAELVIQRHFPHLTVDSISHINRGYNNRVYIVTTSDSHEYILRLGGRFWTQYKTENEVAALLYIAKYCKSIPVPKIFGYCTDKEKSGVCAEYILMEKIAGEPLENIWNDLDHGDKMNIASQVAAAAAKIQAIRFSKCGSFQFSPERISKSHGLGVVDIGENDISVGKGVEFDGGPFSTFLEYFISTCETEINELKKCAFMHGSEGYNERLTRIQKFVSAFEDVTTLPDGINREAVENVPFVFTHGDLEPRNIMVNKETKKLTGILDWEFSGSYPIDEEWFTGFAFVDGDTSDWRAFNEERPTYGHNDEHPSDPEVANSLRQDFFIKMRNCGAVVPDDIPGHIIRAELYYFKGYICPWWLREKRNPIPDTHYGDRSNACKKVDCVLTKYGF